MPDTLIVILFALGIAGGLLYLLAAAVTVIDWTTTWFNIWSLVRAESKTNMALIVDRTVRGWKDALPFKVRIYKRNVVTLKTKEGRS